jgi:hypothetical protein
MGQTPKNVFVTDPKDPKKKVEAVALKKEEVKPTSNFFFIII